ncbi:MAG: ATPase BadF/BadG/BcrA/BcrD type [Verrucomicrobia bacterium]|nr:ATPase BadF/BadG/BcrA/BcrD type [Verrucomicrobiota bacterium]
MSYKIGVDGGGTKTECVVVDLAGHLVASHVGPGCNPSVIGPERATSLSTGLLEEMRGRATAHFSQTHGHAADPASLISTTLLCMAGHRSFWQDLARNLRGFGRVTTTGDSRPVLELATAGAPGVVLHAGTGSFVAGRAPDGSLHYAGGLGWRFGDPGSAYDIGRRAVTRGLLELQGWAPPSPLGAAVRRHAEVAADADAGDVTRSFYQHPDPNRHVAAFAPSVLALAADGVEPARDAVRESAGGLCDLAVAMAEKLFPADQLAGLHAGLSGPILTQPFVHQALAARASFALVPVAGSPIDGVRRLLAAG